MHIGTPLFKILDPPLPSGSAYSGRTDSEHQKFLKLDKIHAKQ